VHLRVIAGMRPYDRLHLRLGSRGRGHDEDSTRQHYGLAARPVDTASPDATVSTQVGQIECDIARRASIASSAAAGGKAHLSAIRTRPHQAQRGTISPRSNSVQISEKRPGLFSDSQVETTAA